MFKVCIVLALAVASVAAQEAAAPVEAAPEPYSYAYSTDSHAASEQRDPSGKVTGFYTLVDADGRERRVEYIADEAGFRAKIDTNEVGTKSANPADVEINASEPTPQQFVLYQQAQAAPAAPAVVPQVQYQVQQQQAPRLIQQTVAPRLTATTTTLQQQPIRSQVSYTLQQPQYGYAGYTGNAGYYTTGYYNQPGYAYGAGYNSGYNSLLNVGNYNNHLPSQYYRSVSTNAPAGYAVNSGANYRFVSQPAVTSGVRTVGYPAAGAVSYGVAPGITTTTTRSSGLQGSSNYLVLQKRSAEEKKN